MAVIYKVTTDGGSGLDFVMSDATVDRYGDIVEPAGWVLSAFKKNPIALFGHNSAFPIGTWSNVRVEGGRLIGSLNLAKRGTSYRLDELISLVEQGVLRAVSVGFVPLKNEPIDPEKPSNGTRFLKQELLETSLCAVGANPAALALAKSLNVSNETMTLAFGEHAEMETREMPTGKQATTPPKSKAKSMTTLSQRIENAQTNYNAARDAYQAHVGEDDYDIDQAKALQDEMESRGERLSSLKDAEGALAASAVTGTALAIREPAKPGAPPIRRPLGVKEREPQPGDLFVRAAVCQVLAKVTGEPIEKVLEDRYRDHEATNIVVRAAVDPGKTTVAGWAAELIETETVAFLERLRPISVYARLAELGTSLTFGPGRGAIKVPARSATPSISGSFVAEGAPIPVRRIGLTSATLSPHKVGVISYFTEELAMMSNPQIEALLREEIEADTALTLDTLLLDATVGSTTRPAGLTYGVSALTASSAGGYAAIIEDIQALAAPFDSANAGRTLALIMNPQQRRYLRMTPGPDGTFGWADPFLDEFTIISSTTVPAGDIFLIDAADFATAGGAPEFKASQEAVIHAEDTTPLQIGTAGSPPTIAAPVISMYQTASIALRMLMTVTWAMRRAGMVQWIDASDWAPVAP